MNNCNRGRTNEHQKFNFVNCVVDKIEQDRHTHPKMKLRALRPMPGSLLRVVRTTASSPLFLLREITP